MAARTTVVNAKKAVVAINIDINSELSSGPLQRQVGEGLGAVGR